MTKKSRKCAVVCARGLGDGLLSLILTHNLTLSGHRVTTFSSILCQLKSWFPNFAIEPYPKPEAYHATFSSFDRIIVADHALLNSQHNFGNELLILKESSFDPSQTMVENLAAVCRHRLQLSYCLKENGITIPPSLKKQAHRNRVIIHPTSSDEKKNWPQKKYLSLCEQLLRLGKEPAICVSPEERPSWEPLITNPKIALPNFPTVSELACYVYESGLMIGNDSGVGHLASCLHIPTLSLFARKSYAKLWRPGWGPGAIVTPPNVLIGSRLKQRFWKSLLTVRTVVRKLDPCCA